MQIVVIGTGYVGLVAGAGFSDFGNDVTCVDIDEDRVRALARGIIPFHEPNLAPLVHRNMQEGRLSFTTDTVAAVDGADVIFLAVGTPAAADGTADLSALEAAARQVGRGLTGRAVIATKSTVPVGTGDSLRAIIRSQTRCDFSMASNPEFLKEGDAVNDFMKPQRVILGVEDERSLSLLRDLYAPFLRVSDRIHVMDLRSAELAKYAANAMLATRISLMNELALLADSVGADIDPVRRAVGADPRIGGRFLFPGAGFGGSCLPKDLRALAHMGREAGAELAVVEAARDHNERQKRVLGERVLAHFGRDLRGHRVGVWGLSFKPETDDLREAPALTLIDQLRDAGARVVAYDPAAGDRAREQLGDAIDIAATMYGAAEGCDALALVTEWRVFRNPDFRRLRGVMRQPVLFDGRNVWSPDHVRELGFAYCGIGRRAATPSSTRAPR